MPARRSLLIALVALAGCADSEDPPLPAACTEGAGHVERALGRAPGEVRLADGTLLSECVRRATSDSELQNLGLVLTEVAEDLEAGARRVPVDALRLGYLVGAARRGAPGDSRVQTELVRRLERSAAVDGLPPAAERALGEGMRAGEARG